jgi:hypothetical protein
VTGCGKRKPDPWLAALRQERLARLVPPGGSPIVNVETNTRDTAFSKPNAATISRGFSYRTRDRAVHGRNVALRAAVATGWRVNRQRTTPAQPYYGWKRLPLGEATVIIGEYKKGNRFRVTIQLQQGACPLDLCGHR